MLAPFATWEEPSALRGAGMEMRRFLFELGDSYLIIIMMPRIKKRKVYFWSILGVKNV